MSLSAMLTCIMHSSMRVPPSAVLCETSRFLLTRKRRPSTRSSEGFSSTRQLSQRTYSTPSTSFIPPTTQVLAVSSTVETRCSTVRRHGTRIICTSRRGGFSSTRPRRCSHSLPTSSKSKFLDKILHLEVGHWGSLAL